MSSHSFNYDVVIVGAGIAGCSFAHALATLSQKPLKICLLERSLAEPDRIVGELLQPWGVETLKIMGMVECLEEILLLRHITTWSERYLLEVQSLAFPSR